MNADLKTTAIAASPRTQTPVNLRDLAIYPFLVLLAYLPFVLYMHRSKIGPRGLNIDSMSEQIAYYHADLVLYVLVACLLWLAKPIRRWSLLIFTALYCLATFDWLSWHIQSKSFFFADLYRAIQLIAYYPEFVWALPTGFKTKAAILLALPLFLLFLFRQQWTFTLASILRTPLNLACGFLALATLALTPWLISSAFVHQNSIAQMISEQLHDLKLEGIVADRESMKVPLGQHEPTLPPVFDHTRNGPARNNVIIFIIETTALPQYPDLAELAASLEHPWLKNNSITFSQHYSTYPASDRASFSILSGLYPPMLQHNNWKGSMRYGDSLPKALGSQGYTSYLFSTSPLSFYNDELMYDNLGFNYLKEVEETKNLRVQTENGYEWDRDRLYEMDEALIQMAIDTLRQHSREHAGPFLASIAPQSSHAPFSCPPAYREQPEACQSDIAKIRTNATWQFGLIERLIRALETSGLLDSTILMITGDHGIRSVHETTLFPNPNLLQQITFHVPMMLASSQLGDAPRRINHPTSHVDIAPTTLDLLGIPRDDLYFHGRNLFATSPRTIYFIGTGYSPVTGFLQDNRFYMENRSNDLFLSAPAMDFNDRSKVTSNTETQHTITEELLKLEAFLRREYLVPAELQ